MGLLTAGFPFGRWFRRLRSRPADGPTEPDLETLRARAAEAPASLRPQHYLRAARLAESSGLAPQALTLYGQAIDGYLETGRDRAAEVVCREVIEKYPHVVRTRRTLALIALGRGNANEAATLLREYAEVAKRFGDVRMTRKSLRAIGLISAPGPVRSEAVAELSALGDEAGAQLVRESEAIPQDQFFGGDSGSWSKALEAALMGGKELRNLSTSTDHP